MWKKIDRHWILYILFKHFLLGWRENLTNIFIINDHWIWKFEFNYLILYRCKAYPAYPRIYVAHAWTVFSDIETEGCRGDDWLFQMDRIVLYCVFSYQFWLLCTLIKFVEKHYLAVLHWGIIAIVLQILNTGNHSKFVIQNWSEYCVRSEARRL